ncbi:MurR/RpiR family transcriptional regulator [Pseudonocardia alni]|uniref:MurR/RpiR family transcriptional regulator n=1 Tax=Pseudonocardia alni TaxID=33907 RepID=UPI00280BF6E3|nr:MurR/RpiR family transcriptional regulator [Pseudonocardia alni]
MDRPVSPRVDPDARPALALVGSITARIRALRPSLSPTGARIGDAVLVAPAEIVALTVSELADRTDTSVGSVVRFCQDTLELKGFHDLKLRLAAETATGVETAKGRDGTPADTVHAVLQTALTGLDDLAGALDHAVLVEITQQIRRADRVLVAGVGTSAPIAADAGYRLRMLGVHAEVLTDPHQQHLAARTLGTTGCCLAISHTGQTQETLTTLRAATDAGAVTVGITSYLRSPFTELCQHNIIAGATEQHGLEATASRLVHLTVVDLLVALLADLDPTTTTRAQQLYTDAVAAHRV